MRNNKTEGNIEKDLAVEICLLKEGMRSIRSICLEAVKAGSESNNHKHFEEIEKICLNLLDDD